MAHTIGAVLGWVVLLGGTGALALALGRRAASYGILAPLLVGFVLRLVVMLIAHAGSLSLHDGGIFFLDDQTYLHGGTRLADAWSGGHFPNPARYYVLGTYQFGYQAFLGVIFTLGTNSVLLGKLANVALGTVTVLVIARLGGRLLGDRAQRPAAWLAALAPNLVWWSAPLMKEALATLLLPLGLLAVTYLPRRRAVATVAAVVAALLVVRTSAALALLLGTGVAVAIAGRQTERRWLSRPLLGFVATGLATIVVVAVVLSRGYVTVLFSSYHAVIARMFHTYQGGNLTHVPFDAAKALVTPLPWVFDSGTQNWDRGLYPGVWLLICLYPLAFAGVWRLRRRAEVGILVVPVIVALLANAITAGFVFRQRSMIEPLILLLALAGAPSWRVAGRLASAALAVTAVIAGVQSRSPLVLLVVLAAAAAVLLATRRLPPRPFDPLPESPLVAGFEAQRTRAG